MVSSSSNVSSIFIAYTLAIPSVLFISFVSCYHDAWTGCEQVKKYENYTPRFLIVILHRSEIKSNRICLKEWHKQQQQFPNQGLAFCDIFFYRISKSRFASLFSDFIDTVTDGNFSKRTVLGLICRALNVMAPTTY